MVMCRYTRADLCLSWKSEFSFPCTTFGIIPKKCTNGRVYLSVQGRTWLLCYNHSLEHSHCFRTIDFLQIPPTKAVGLLYFTGIQINYIHTYIYVCVCVCVWCVCVWACAWPKWDVTSSFIQCCSVNNKRNYICCSCTLRYTLHGNSILKVSVLIMISVIICLTTIMKLIVAYFIVDGWSVPVRGHCITHWVAVAEEVVEHRLFSARYELTLSTLTIKRVRQISTTRWQQSWLSLLNRLLMKHALE